MNKKILSTLAVIVIVFASFTFATATFAQPDGKVRVIIGFKGNSDAALVRGNGGEISYQYKYVSAIAASLPPQAIAALQKNPNVAYVEPDFEVEALGRPGKPVPTPTATPVPTQTIPWGVDQIGAPSAWAFTKGAGIKVAVIDTGIDTKHSDLKVVGGKSFVFAVRSYNDDNGHGTHCAGTIAALDNNYGVVGVAPLASLYAVKVLDRTGNGYLSWVVAGIDWSIDNSMQVISMSLGAPTGSDTLEAICYQAYNTYGIVIVAAAGNSGPNQDTVEYPARYASVIAVGATDKEKTIAEFSSRGSQLSVVAPGVDILSTYSGNRLATGSGTSMACPHVAGTVALMLSKGVSSTNVRNSLETTADLCPSQTAKDDPTYGYGLVNTPIACGLP